jgi:hypothetical protein
MALSDHGWPPSGYGHLGPFVASDGDLFIVGHGGTTAIEVLRSTDGGSAWGTPVASTAGRNVDYLSSTQSGDTLYVAWATVTYASGMNTLYDLEYREFNMATNAWAGSVDIVDSPNLDTATIRTPDVARRTSDTVILYSGDHHVDMGNDFSSVVYARGTAGSWGTTGVAVAANTGGVNWHPGLAIVGSQAGECHFIWGRITATDALEARTLDGANSLSTMVSQGYGSGSPFPISAHAVTWDDAGTQRIAIIKDAAASALNVERYNEDASDDIAHTDTTSDITGAFTADASGIRRALALDPSSDDVYAFASGDGVGESDLYHTVGTDAQSFGSMTEDEDAITAVRISSSGYSRSGDKIGYIVDNSGTTIFGEIDLGGGAAPVYPPFPRRPHTSVRM